MIRKSFSRIALAAVVSVLALTGPASAQLQTGNIHGTVYGQDRVELPGVTVTLTGIGAPQVQVTDEQGKFHFLGLSPGVYTTRAELQGYVTVERTDIDVSVGRNTDIELTLGFGDTIEVVGGEAPLLDPRRVSIESHVSRDEMDKVPSARDPWAVLGTVPGVRTDRINVGGNESGQQSTFVGPGAAGAQTVWSLDGMVITDMSAAGSTPGYFNFEAFEEMQVTTGGSDASIATGGVVLNMVTRRGTDQWRGSARYLAGDEGMQSDLEIDAGELGQAGPWNQGTAQDSLRQGNRIVDVVDYGVEVGGPLVSRKLWIWGSYGEQQIDLLTVNDFSDDTTLEDWNLKLNGQITPSNSATAFAWQSDKIKIGRNAGPLRPQETTWNQSGFGPEPTAWKIEDTQIIGSNFFLTGMYSVVNGGLELAPEGGDRVPFLDPNGIWRNSFLHVQVERPQEQLRLDASNFFSTGDLSHELKYGAGYRVVEQSTVNRWPGGGIDVGGVLLLAREGIANVEVDYSNLFVQDTVSVGNLTASVGLRYDRQGGELLDTSVAANPVFPELLPATSFEGRDSGFEWSTLSPRLGLTYSLGESRKTLLRASYSRFADQLATAFAGWLHPLGAPQYRYFLTTNDGGPTLDPGELGDEIGAPSGNLNPFTLAPLISNAVDTDLNAPITDELILGIEHSLRPELVVGFNVNYRQLRDLLEAELLVFDGDPVSAENLNSTGRVHRRDDYVPRFVEGVLPNGEPYSLSYWTLREGVGTRNGFLLENGDREQEFLGASLSIHKRLSNRWMARGNVSWQDWTWDIPDSENEDPTDTIAGGIVNGTDVLQGSGVASGAKGNVFISSGWSYSLNGLYQIAPEQPWGFNLGASLNGREGYPLRYARRVNRAPIADTPGVGLDVPVASDANTFRFPDVHLLDLRVEKEFRLSDFGVTVGADVFNVLNESYVLQRQSVLNLSSSDHVLEVLSPRILRLGVRLSWR
ncbi:MAG TPA: TonB-dependent receptor [Thermoanaerobaculia bacterium]|nr:TonB-dependent receptor [Thermoanaerobaculia bacterium]